MLRQHLRNSMTVALVAGGTADVHKAKPGVGLVVVVQGWIR